MNSMLSGIVSLVVTAALAGCAGQTEQLSMQTPTGQAPQSVTFPNGTTFGGGLRPPSQRTGADHGGGQQQ